MVCDKFDPNPFKPTMCRTCQRPKDEHAQDGPKPAKAACRMFEPNPFKPDLCKVCQLGKVLHDVPFDASTIVVTKQSAQSSSLPVCDTFVEHAFKPGTCATCRNPAGVHATSKSTQHSSRNTREAPIAKPTVSASPTPAPAPKAAPSPSVATPSVKAPAPSPASKASTPLPAAKVEGGGTVKSWGNTGQNAAVTPKDPEEKEKPIVATTKALAATVVTKQLSSDSAKVAEASSQPARSAPAVSAADALPCVFEANVFKPDVCRNCRKPKSAHANVTADQTNGTEAANKPTNSSSTSSKTTVKKEDLAPPQRVQPREVVFAPKPAAASHSVEKEKEAPLPAVRAKVGLPGMTLEPAPIPSVQKSIPPKKASVAKSDSSSSDEEVAQPPRKFVVAKPSAVTAAAPSPSGRKRSASSSSEEKEDDASKKPAAPSKLVSSKAPTVQKKDHVESEEGETKITPSPSIPTPAVNTQPSAAAGPTKQKATDSDNSDDGKFIAKKTVPDTPATPATNKKEIAAVASSQLRKAKKESDSSSSDGDVDEGPHPITQQKAGIVAKKEEETVDAKDPVGDKKKNTAEEQQLKEDEGKQRTDKKTSNTNAKRSSSSSSEGDVNRQRAATQHIEKGEKKEAAIVRKESVKKDESDAAAAREVVPKFIARAPAAKKSFIGDSDSDEDPIKTKKVLAVKPQLKPSQQVKYNAGEDSDGSDGGVVVRRGAAGLTSQPAYTTLATKAKMTSSNKTLARNGSDGSESDSDSDGGNKGKKKSALAPQAKRSFDPTQGANHHNRFRLEKSSSAATTTGAGSKAFATEDDDDFSAPVVKKTLTKSNDLFK